MKIPVTTALALILSVAPAFAQSLNPNSPSPLQPGVNRGTVDSIVGPHYWYFTAGPGQSLVHASFTSMGLYGSPQRTNLTVTLSDADNTWHAPHVLTSQGKAVDYTFTGNPKKQTKMIVTVAPPSNSLIRAGGDYQLEVSGVAAFGSKSDAEPIVHIYKQMCGYTAALGNCKFQSDGTVATTSGASGTWKLFDRDSNTYVIAIEGQDKHSLQYVAGRGLCDGDSIWFQEIR